MQLVDNDTFLKRLASLFESTKARGSSVWLTHKRLTHDGEDAAMKPSGSSDTREYPCLIRATDGKEKFSTTVESHHLDKMHAAYGALLKSSMTTLRKRDKKREKERAEKIARRKRRLAEPVVIEGPKRGNGRKKRQRRIKAALKQQEQQKRAKQREAESKKRGKVHDT